MDEEVRAGRDFLKASWDRLERIETDQARGIAVPVQEEPCPPGSELIRLPQPIQQKTDDRPLFELIAARKSRRKYSAESIRLEELSYLLWAVEGVRESKPKYSFRTVPSAGARNPLDLYLYVARVDGLKTGLYRYLPLEHGLVLVREEPSPLRLDQALKGQYWNAAAVFMWVAVPYRTEWRYSIASHKLVALDAGHSCQNLYLACESLGLGTCAVGAYDQRSLDTFLGLNGNDSFAVYTAPIGRI